MVITAQQATTRLNSEKNLANRFSRKATSPSYAEDKPSKISSDDNDSTNQATVTIHEVPILRPGNNRSHLSVEQRNEIAIRSKAGEKGTKLAKEFGVTSGKVSMLKTGNHTPGKTDEDAVSNEVRTIQDKALSKLMTCLNLMDDDKLSGCNAKDLSSIAVNAARIVEKMSPKDVAPQQTTVIIYSPELRNESTFKTVNV